MCIECVLESVNNNCMAIASLGNLQELSTKINYTDNCNFMITGTIINYADTKMELIRHSVGAKLKLCTLLRSTHQSIVI